VLAIRFNNYYFYFKRPISDSSRNTRWIDHTHLLLYKLILPSKKYNDKLIRQKYKLIIKKAKKKKKRKKEKKKKRNLENPNTGFTSRLNSHK
jgi:hypothetical protein